MNKLSKLKKSTYLTKKLHEETTHLWQMGNGETKSQLKLSSWNVNGFRSVVNKKVLESYLKQDHDIFCFNQTKICYKNYIKERQRLTNQLQLQSKGYYQFWNFCKVSSGYSGTCVFTKHKPINMMQDIPGCQQHSLQGRVITLEFDKFFLVNCYKPNSGSLLQRLEYRTLQYEKSFTSFINSLQTKKPVIVVGDLNVAHQQIDLKNPNINAKSPGFTDEQRLAFNMFLAKTQLRDSWRYQYPNEIGYTWWSYANNSRSKNIGWRIDYILVDPKIQILQTSIRNDIQGSDHCPVQAKIRLI